jgi:hypothetical protein
MEDTGMRVCSQHPQCSGQRNRDAFVCLAAALMLLLLPGFIGQGLTETLRIPVNIDYSLVRSLFVQQAFSGPGESAAPVDLDNGCTRVELSQPQVGPEKSLLKLASNIRLSLGLPLGQTCLKLTQWDGRIEVLQQLLFDQQNMRLGLNTLNYRALTFDGKPTTFDQKSMGLLQTYLGPFLNQVNLDLSGPLQGLQNLLPLFYGLQDQSRLQSLLGTLRLGEVRVTPNGLSMEVLMDVATLAKGAPEVSPPGIEAGDMLKSWEDFDSFSVTQMEALFGQNLTDDDRQNLLETLIDRRHEFVQSWSEGTLDKSLIGRQFSSTWTGLAPILKKYLGGQTSRSPASFLSFLTVSDALVALNRVQAFGSMTPSKDGLMGLLQLLGVTAAEPLQYSYGVKGDLRTFLGFSPPIDESGPAFDGLEIDLPGGSWWKRDAGFFWSWLKVWPSPAFAAASPLDSKEINLWVMPKGDVSSYLTRVRAALDQGATEALSKGRLAQQYHSMYRQLVLATGWQESCWRQFIGTGEKIRTISSYNQTSVGLMQINERVWRGIYRPESLRWNIAYNIRAGCEILELYLRQYALRKPEAKKLDSDTLARAVYAMYNGGPGHFAKFLTRNKTNKLFLTDKLFREKQTWVKSNQLDKLKVCLGR